MRPPPFTFRAPPASAYGQAAGEFPGGNRPGAELQLRRFRRLLPPTGAPPDGAELEAAAG